MCTEHSHSLSQQVQTPLQEHHNQIVVKEELSEVEIGDSELQKTMEKSGYLICYIAACILFVLNVCVFLFLYIT